DACPRPSKTQGVPPGRKGVRGQHVHALRRLRACHPGRIRVRPSWYGLGTELDIDVRNIMAVAGAAGPATKSYAHFVREHARHQYRKGSKRLSAGAVLLTGRDGDAHHRASGADVHREVTVVERRSHVIDDVLMQVIAVVRYRIEIY